MINWIPPKASNSIKYLGKNILSEVNTVVNYGLQPILVVISQSIIASLILILIFVSNFKLAILLLTFFSITYAIIFLIFNPFLKRMGEERSITNSKRFKLLNETFGAFKIIKLLGLENDYLKFGRYDEPRPIINENGNKIPWRDTTALEDIDTLIQYQHMNLQKLIKW